MKRYDRRRKYHVLLLAIISIAVLTGWLLRGPVGATLAGVLPFLQLAEQLEIIGACYRIGWVLSCGLRSGNWLGHCVVCPAPNPEGRQVRLSPCTIGKRYSAGTPGGWLWGSCWQSIFPVASSQNPL